MSVANLWSSCDVRLALGLPASDNEWHASGVSIDSRTLRRGDIFVALCGDAYDGHDFIWDAIAGGAAGIIGESTLDDLAGLEDVEYLQVSDSLVGLQDMARFRRSSFGGKVVAVTGSVGKTMVKEMLLHVLGLFGKCSGSIGNLNNHIGLPLSMVNLSLDSDFGVFELGMNHGGEIEFLTEIVRSDLACVTNVRVAHMVNFADLEDVAFAKAEIFASSPGGALIFSDGSGSDNILRASAKEHGVVDVRTFGLGGGCDYRLVDYTNSGGRVEFSADLGGDLGTYLLGVRGEHAAMAGVMVLGIVDMLGLDCSSGLLSNFSALCGRGEIFEVSLPDGGRACIIDESYNSSPSSVASSLKLLSEFSCERGGRSVAILGDMLELGDDQTQYHLNVRDDFMDLGIDCLVSVGSLMGRLYNSIPDENRLLAVDNKEQLLLGIWNLVERGDILLFKGSHSIGLGDVVASLKSGYGV